MYLILKKLVNNVFYCCFKLKDDEDTFLELSKKNDITIPKPKDNLINKTLEKEETRILIPVKHLTYKNQLTKLYYEEFQNNHKTNYKTNYKITPISYSESSSTEEDFVLV